MESRESSPEVLSPWWRYGVVLTIILGITVLVFMSTQAYMNAPPIPEGVVGHPEEWSSPELGVRTRNIF